MDLSLFQFDYDQSFAVFFLNADGTIYGRFGTRSHRTHWSDDVSIEGLAQAMKGALELHAAYPSNKAQLAAKRGPKPEYAAPEQFPQHKGRYTSTLDYQGKVVQSCIHCHQIGDALREVVRTRNDPLPESLLFPYPHPKAIGLVLDPGKRATVRSVGEGSPAARAGFRPGDEIVSLAGQPLLSIADVQWVLHQTRPTGSELTAKVRRGDQTANLTLTLPSGWRKQDDISWRASSWGLRRMATGGLVLEALTDEQRREASLPEDSMALRVKHVGQYGAHAAAQRAGFRQGDIVVAFDGQTTLAREADLMAYALQQRRPGESVSVTVLRSGKEVTLKLPMQP
jgi:predicted metalloprotease with PDZ domain